MKKSLQDQLIKAGLSNKQQARQINTAKKKNKGQSTDEPGIAEDKRAKQAEKDRQRNKEFQAAALAKAEQTQVLQLITSNTLPVSHKGLPYYFVVESKVHKLIVNEQTRIKLAFGQLGIVKLAKEDAFEFLIVPDHTLKKLHERRAEKNIVWQQDTQSLKDYLEANHMEDWTYPRDAFG